MKNYYEELNVSTDASKEEIKKAYIKLAKRYHPDRAKGIPKEIAERYMKDINEAYNILSDDKKRKEYDLKRNPPVTKMPKKQEDNFSYSQKTNNKNENTSSFGEYEWMMYANRFTDTESKIDCYTNARNVAKDNGRNTDEIDAVLMKLHLKRAEETGSYYNALKFADLSGNKKYMILLRFYYFGRVLHWAFSFNPTIMLILYFVIFYSLASWVYDLFIPKKIVPKIQEPIKQAITFTQPPVEKDISDDVHIACVKDYFTRLKNGQKSTTLSPWFVARIDFKDMFGVLNNWIDCSVDITDIKKRGTRREIHFILNGKQAIDINGNPSIRDVKIQGGAETIVSDGIVMLNLIELFKDITP